MLIALPQNRENCLLKDLSNNVLNYQKQCFIAKCFSEEQIEIGNVSTCRKWKALVYRSSFVYIELAFVAKQVETSFFASGFKVLSTLKHI